MSSRMWDSLAQTLLLRSELALISFFSPKGSCLLDREKNENESSVPAVERQSQEVE